MAPLACLSARVQGGRQWTIVIVDSERVQLETLDEESLQALLQTAVADADPVEVMPPVGGSAGWNGARRQAFLDFHRSRSLVAEPVENTYVIVVDGQVVGAARLSVCNADRELEAGVWIGRSHRGCGVGAAVGSRLLAAARRAGARRLVAATTAENATAQRLLINVGANLVEDPDDKLNLSATLDLTGVRQLLYPS